MSKQPTAPPRRADFRSAKIGPANTGPAKIGPAKTGSAEDRAHYHRAVLHEILAVGANLVDLVHQEVRIQSDAILQGRPPSAEAVSDLSVAFDRITRAMRRTIEFGMLEEPLAAQPARPRSLAQRRTDVRKAIIREVENIIHDTFDEADATTLTDQFYVRLDAPDIEDDLHQRPVAEIIREICADLGIEQPDEPVRPRRRTPDDVARLCARAAAPPAPPDHRIGNNPPSRRTRH